MLAQEQPAYVVNFNKTHIVIFIHKECLTFIFIKKSIFRRPDNEGPISGIVLSLPVHRFVIKFIF